MCLKKITLNSSPLAEGRGWEKGKNWRLPQHSGTGSTLGDWLTKGACPRHWRKKCSSGFEIRLHGIGDLQSQLIHSKRVLRNWDPPLTPDGLQIRQILSPLIGAALKQGSVAKQQNLWLLTFGSLGGVGVVTKKRQLTIYLSEQIN